MGWRPVRDEVRHVQMLPPLDLFGNLLPPQREPQQFGPDLGRGRAAHGLQALLGNLSVLGRRSHGQPPMVAFPAYCQNT